MSTTPVQEDEALVHKLYRISASLDTASVNGSQEKKEELYKSILKIAGSKGNGFNKAKTLAAQLIARHVKDLPNLVEESVNVLMDLCEEVELQVLLQAVKAFPAVCSQNLAQLPRVADVLGQLLQADLPQELDNVKQSLLALFRLDANGVLNTLTNQILTRNEDQRKKAIEFLLSAHMKEAIEEKIYTTENLQSPFFDNIKKILASPSTDLSPEQITQFLELLNGLPTFQTSNVSHNSNASQVLDAIAIKAQLDKPVEKGDLESIEKKAFLIRAVIPYFSEQISSSNFMQSILSNFVPQFPELTDDIKMKILKIIAEISPFVATSEAREIIPSIYSLFKQHTTVNSTKINFSFLECILYSFHQLACKVPGSLSHVCGIQQFTGQPSDIIPTASDDTPNQLLEDFTSRLEFVKENTWKYLQQLKTTLQSNLEKGQRETIQSAYYLTKNIHSMVNSLLNKPNPIFLNNKSLKVALSWKEPLGKRKNESSNLNSEQQQKRKKTNNNSNSNYPPKKFYNQNKDFAQQSSRGKTFTRGRGNSNVTRGFSNRGRGTFDQSRPRGRF